MLESPHKLTFKKNSVRVVCGLLFAVFFVANAPAPLVAQDQFGVDYGVNTGLSTRDVRETIVNIIRISLGVLGVVALVILIYGGVVWMTAGGDPGKIETARKIMLNAAIGLVIIFLAFAVVQYIFSALSRSTGLTISCTPFVCTRCNYQCDASGTGEIFNPSQCGSLCGGGLPGGTSMSVAWASPRGSNVSLCTIVQFKVSSNAVNGLDPATVNDSTFKATVSNAVKGNGTACGAPEECRSGVCANGTCAGNSVPGSRSVTGRTAEFLPSADWISNTEYRVTVEGGGAGIKSLPIAPGRTVLSLSSTYTWSFTTGSTQDTEPPQVIDASLYPFKGETDVCLATHLQTQFSEPMRASTLLATGSDPNSTGSENSIVLQPGVVGWNKDVPRVDWLDAAPTPDAGNVNYTPLRANTPYTAALDADVVQDTCLNFLDGDADGVAEGSSGGDDYDIADPWTFTTGVTAECTPEITSIAPALVRYDDAPGSELLITGRHFYNIGSVNFSYDIDVVPGDQAIPGTGTMSCLDSSGTNPTYYPSQLCLAQNNWTPTSIRTRVPAMGGTSGGAVSGDIFVQVGSEKSKSQFLTVASPHINSGPTPRKGGRGQYITLSGAQFGNVSGKVYLKSTVNPALEYEAQPTDCASSTWSDSQIVVKVPTGASLPLGFYYLQVQDAGGKRSNFSPDAFEVTTQAPGPGLCSAAPSCGITNTSVTLEGVGFGTSGQVTFGGSVGTVGSGDWTNTQIIVSAPAGLKTGNNPIVVTSTGNSTPSNALSFLSPCGIGIGCDRDLTTAQCEPGGCGSGYVCSVAASCSCVPRIGTGPQPRVTDHWPSCTAACINSAIGAAFDQDMDASAFSGNVRFYGCPASNPSCSCTGSQGSPCSNLTDLTSQTTLAIQTRSVDITLNGGVALNPQTAYRVVTRGGAGGVKSSTGMELGGLNFDTDADAIDDAYSWTFKTKNGACTVDFVDVEPATARLAISARLNYEAIPYSRNVSCSNRVNRLNITSGFSWRSCDIVTAADCSLSCPSGSRFATVTGGSPSNTATAEGIAAGDVYACSFYQTSQKDGGSLAVTSPCKTNADCEKSGLCPGSTCIQSGVNKGLCTPIVKPSPDGLKPDNGALGTWVTVQGCYFGNSPGVAEFTGVSARVLARFPSQTNPQCVGDEWTDMEVVLEVPDVTTPTDTADDAVDGPVYITTVNKVTATSPSNFDVNLTTYPGLCRLDPSRGYEADLVHLYGKGFGNARAGGDEVVFSTNVLVSSYPNDISCPANGWSDGEICAEVPSGAVTGDAVVDLAAQPPSNPKTFTVLDAGGDIGDSCNGDPEAPQCVPVDSYCNQDLWCDPDPVKDPNGIGCTCQQSPAPSATLDPPDGAANVCRNAILSAQFDQLVNFSTVASSTRPGLFLNANIVDTKICAADARGRGIAQFIRALVSKILPSARAQSCPTRQEPVPFSINFVTIPESTPENPTTCTSFDGKGCTAVYMSPQRVLSSPVLGDCGATICLIETEKIISYTYGVTSYTDPRFGVKSGYGIKAIPSSATFTVGSDICQIDFVTVTVTPPGKVKNSDLFTCAGRDNCPGDAADGLDAQGKTDPNEPVTPGNQHYWLAQAKTRVTNPASSVTANYLWEEHDPQNLYVMSGTMPAEKYITADGTTNGTGSFIIGAFDPSDVAGSATTTISVATNICDVPWPGVEPYTDANFNFSFWYCRDQKQEYVCDDNPSQSCTLDGTECGTGSCIANTVNDLPEFKVPFNQQNNVSVCNSYSGNAGTYCIGDTECTPGAACENGTCNAKSANAGAACTGSADCADQKACVPDLLQDNIITFDVSTSDPVVSDTIGLKIVKNSQHLSARGWFDVFSQETFDVFSQETGEVSRTTVDGYDAVVSGRTTYINAANEGGSGVLYTNIYLLSFCKPTVNSQGSQDCASAGAGGVIDQVFSQIKKNWRFNTNLTDTDMLAMLRRDTERIGELGVLKALAEQYKASHGGSYPLLSAGTFVEGMSTSKWPSWQSFLETTLPIDPLNQWGSVPPDASVCVFSGGGEPENQCIVSAGAPLCCDESQQLGKGAQCSAGACILCPIGYDLQSCWSEAMRTFYCPAESHVYLYQTKGAATAPKVYAQLEYNPTAWDDLDTTSGTFNPCSGIGNNNCGCFNVRL